MTVLMRSMLMLVLLVAGLALWSAPANAQPQVPRTWVAAAGDDSNLCIRAAPCRTFVVAHARTAPGGKISCVGPANYGPVTITKSITIDCGDDAGSIFVANNDAITILAQPTDSIVIDGLAIGGLIGGGQSHGIRLVQAGSLVVRNASIRGFPGQAISFAPGSNASLQVDNVTISEAGTAGNQATGGIEISPGDDVVASVTLTNVRMGNVASVGIRSDLTGRTPGTRVRMVIERSVIAATLSGVNVKAPTGNGTAAAFLDGTTVSGASIGLFANGAGASMRVTGSRIVHVTFPLFTTASGAIISHGDNVLAYNTNAGSFTSTVPTQ